MSLTRLIVEEQMSFRSVTRAGVLANAHFMSITVIMIWVLYGTEADTIVEARRFLSFVTAYALVGLQRSSRSVNQGTNYMDTLCDCSYAPCRCTCTWLVRLEITHVYNMI